MHLAAGDLNGDGFPDVVASFVQPGMSPYAAEVFVLTGDGKGKLHGQSALRCQPAGAGSCGHCGGRSAQGRADEYRAGQQRRESERRRPDQRRDLRRRWRGNFPGDRKPDPFDRCGQFGGGGDCRLQPRREPRYWVRHRRHSSPWRWATATAHSARRWRHFRLPAVRRPIRRRAWPWPISTGMAGRTWCFTNNQGITRLYNQPVPTVSPGSLKFAASGTQVRDGAEHAARRPKP